MYNENDELQKMSMDFLFDKEVYKDGGFEKAMAAPSMAINDDKNEEVVLVLGMNPAGDEKTISKEEKGLKYLYFIPDYDIKPREGLYWKGVRGSRGGTDTIARHYKGMGQHCYPFYYGHFFDLFTYLYGVHEWKWGWCNESFEDIENSLRRTENIIGKNLDNQLENIEKYYNNCQNAKLSVYMGDLFYYHATKLNDLQLERVAKDNKDKLKNYIEKMIKGHIDVLKDHNKTVKYVLLCPSKVVIENVFGIKELYKKKKNQNTEKTIVKYCDISGVPVLVGRFIENWKTDNYYENAKELIDNIK